MALLEHFDAILASLPTDWTDLEFDLRIDESRYIDSATAMVTCNAQPYSNHDWHYRVIVAHHFGHAASVGAVRTSLRALDETGIAGEIALRETRAGRAESVQMWGRPESVRQEFRRIRSQ